MDASTQRELRDVFGTFVTGVTVVTTRDAAGTPHGVTANSFSSVSMDPPLVLWSQAKTARSFPAFRDSEHFVVNILGEHQIDISQRFSRSGEDKFGGIPTSTNGEGMPLIDGCSAFIECRKVAAYPGGDHVVFLGHVERFSRSQSKPLAFGGGKYMLAHVHDLGAVSEDPSAATLDQLRALRFLHHALPDVAARLHGIVGLGVWANHGPTVVHWEPGPEPATQDLATGVVLSTVDSATGLAFCAHLPEKKWGRLVESEIASLLPGSRSRAELERQLATVRVDGLAHSTTQSMSLDIQAISAPIFNREGRMVAALTLADRAERLGGEQGLQREQALLQEARALSRRIGWPEQVAAAATTAA